MTEPWEIPTERHRPGQSTMSVHRRRGVALINLMFAINLAVTVAWAIEGWSWRVFLPLAVVDVFLALAIWGCLINDVKAENDRLNGVDAADETG